MSVIKHNIHKPSDISMELQDILMRNGMSAHIVSDTSGTKLMVQGHDSPMMSYAITPAQAAAMRSWGMSSVNRKAYETFTDIVRQDFDIPRAFVSARNAGGRVVIGLHGYNNSYAYDRPRHDLPSLAERCFGVLGWQPRLQQGYHLRRIDGDVYPYAGTHMMTERPDGRLMPGELQSGTYGFYYKNSESRTGQTVAVDVLSQLSDVFHAPEPRPRETQPAKPYEELIYSDMSFSSDAWLECLSSHGIVVDATANTLTIQSATLDKDVVYDLTADETGILTSNSLDEFSVSTRLAVINAIIRQDFQQPVSRDLLSSRVTVSLAVRQGGDLDMLLHPAMSDQNVAEQVMSDSADRKAEPKENNVPSGWTAVSGNDVVIGEISVSGTAEGQYRMTAVINGQSITHEISQRQYEKFAAMDDYHRMKLFDRVFPEVKMQGDLSVGKKIGAALLAFATVADSLIMRPELYASSVERELPRVYYKPGVDTPHDIAARQFETAMARIDAEQDIHRSL